MKDKSQQPPAAKSTPPRPDQQFTDGGMMIPTGQPAQQQTQMSDGMMIPPGQPTPQNGTLSQAGMSIPPGQPAPQQTTLTQGAQTMIPPGQPAPQQTRLTEGSGWGPPGTTGNRNGTSYTVDANGIPRYNVEGQQPTTQQQQATRPGSTQPGSTEWGPVSNQINSTGSINTTGPTAGPLRTSLGPSGAIQGQVGNAGDIQTQLGPSGNIQRNLDLSNLPQYQTAATNVDFKRTFDNSNVPKLVGGDALYGAMTDAQRAAYQNAQGYLDPQWQNEQSALENKLANQGVMQNSEAWNKAMDAFQRQKEFAYTQARTNAVQLGNQANEQLFRQGLSANQNQFGQNLAMGQFYNDAGSREMQQAQFNAQIANQARAAQGQEAIAGMTLGNQAQNQAFGQSLAGGQFANAAQGQRFGQSLAGAQLANAAEGQRFGQDLAGAQFGNQAQNQAFTQGLASQQANNQAQNQSFTQGMAQSQMMNALQEQLARQGLTREQIAAQLQGTQSMANAQASSAATSANASMTNAANALRAQEEQNRFLNSMQMRNQGLTEMQIAQRNPLDMYNMLNNQGVGQPNFTQTPGANMLPPDLSGLSRAGYEGQLNNYNSQVGQQNSNNAAMSSLAAAAIAAYFSDRRLKRNIRRIGTHRAGVPLYAYEYVWGEKGVGVMAQELMAVCPDAVLILPDGFLAVDYGRI